MTGAALSVFAGGVLAYGLAQALVYANRDLAERPHRRRGAALLAGALLLGTFGLLPMAGAASGAGLARIAGFVLVAQAMLQRIEAAPQARSAMVLTLAMIGGGLLLRRITDYAG